MPQSGILAPLSDQAAQRRVGADGPAAPAEPAGAPQLPERAPARLATQRPGCPAQVAP